MTGLFRKLFGPRERREPRVTEGYRVYAIGDVHGRDDLLADLLAQIEADIAGRAKADNIIVFLGDLIDRGPDSAGVVERLRTHRPEGVRLVFLAGNHEEVLLRILGGDEHLVGDWLRYGGAECLKSYGLDPERLRHMPPEQASAAVRLAIPAAHAEFLRGFSDTFRAGDYLFVHAGIRPGIPMTEQSPTDLRWIRDSFLKDSSDHGFLVVHGHTISEHVEQRVNRVGIDTGAYHSGVLTAMAVEGSERWFLQTQQAADTTPQQARAG
jgi:serine/threonine protein phosphatase 1